MDIMLQQCVCQIWVLSLGWNLFLPHDAILVQYMPWPGVHLFVISCACCIKNSWAYCYATVLQPLVSERMLFWHQRPGENPIGSPQGRGGIFPCSAYFWTSVLRPCSGPARQPRERRGTGVLVSVGKAGFSRRWTACRVFLACPL